MSQLIKKDSIVRIISQPEYTHVVHSIDNNKVKILWMAGGSTVNDSTDYDLGYIPMSFQIFDMEELEFVE